jgi:hypothetical protein
MKVRFRGKSYQLVVTDHAEERMKNRNIGKDVLVEILESGSVIPKDSPTHFWVYKVLGGRKDNAICLSISIEDPHLIVITTLINWRPR